MNHPDRRVRAAALEVAKRPGRDNFLRHNRENPLSPRERLALSCWQPGPPAAQALAGYVDLCERVLAREKDPTIRLEVVRLLQIALGDVDTAEGPKSAFIGYRAQDKDRVTTELRQQLAKTAASAFPSGDRPLDLELARLLAMLGEESPGFLERLPGKWTAQSAPEDDIHYLLAMAQVPGKRSPHVTRGTALALAGIHGKMAAKGAAPTDHVPEILEALLDRLLKLDPALPAALVAEPAFGLPGHALFANQLPLAQKQQAARKILGGIARLDEDQVRAAWNPGLVRLVSSLPDKEALPLLRERFADPRLTDTVALVLAASRRPEDRGRLIEALNSLQPGVVLAAAGALLTMPEQQAISREVGKAIRALRRLEGPKEQATRQALFKLLTAWTARDRDPPFKEMKAEAWLAWFSKVHPDEAASLPGLAATNFATWKKKLDRLAWDKGDVGRGLVVFQRKSCFRCHGESRRLGPDLTGVAQRFSRNDLFTAILDPSKDVVPAFRATTILTHSGKVYTGMIIYQSPVLYLLQVTPDTTARIPREELALVQPATVSFMPNGLLDDLNDQELADLYAYLKSLRKR